MGHSSWHATILACAIIPVVMAAQPGSLRAQASSAAFVRWAKSEGTALTSVEPESESAELSAIKAIIGSAKVLALGEPVHGAHEPLAFRNRLLRYLVENLEFTAIAVESGLPESRRLHDY